MLLYSLNIQTGNVRSIKKFSKDSSLSGCESLLVYSDLCSRGVISIISNMYKQTVNAQLDLI